MGCSPKTKKYLVFGYGCSLLVIGLFLGGFMNMIIDSVLVSQLVLSATSLTYDIWKDVPIPLYMEFYLFNVTNAEEYESDPRIKPILKEVGPYIYREYHTRNIIGWNPNSTVTFQTIRTWQFDAANSVGPEEDTVTTLNAVAATINFMGSTMGAVERLFMSSLLSVTGETMFVTKSVKELMFEGYWDKLLNFTYQLNTSIAIPFKEFAYFAERNGSATYDGVFNMYTGADNIDLLGTVAEWNYENHTSFFDAPCNQVGGTTGELWAPIQNQNDVSVFAPDVCSALKLSYTGGIEFLGVDGYGYTLSPKVFNSSDPEESCFCLHDTECAPIGLLNASACRYNAPVFISRPHFMDSDPSLLEAVSGLEPDPALHTFNLALEPVTGVPLYVNARMMLSVMIEPVEYISLFENVPARLYFPILWFNQKATLTDEYATLVKWVLMAPAIGMGIFFGLAGIGALLLFIGIMVTVRNGWKGSDGESLIKN